jgi:hypothetical protein
VVQQQHVYVCEQLFDVGCALRVLLLVASALMYVCSPLRVSLEDVATRRWTAALMLVQRGVESMVVAVQDVEMMMGHDGEWCSDEATN